MKKIFIQFRQRIIKHRKKIIYGTLILLIFQVGFFDIGGIGIENNNVFAADETKQNEFQTKVGEWNQSLSFFKVVLYVLVYPILIVAGKLVDNSMVYGEIFSFDSILWNLRVVIRNIANFGLGGLFMFNIFKYLIKGQNIDDIKKLLISTLIAGVGIQASRFVMSVLIDASTIITYSLGAFPMTVLDEKGVGDPRSLNEEGEGIRTKDPYVLKTTMVYDVDEDANNVQIYMSTGSQLYISECETFNISSEGKVETLILAPKYIYYMGDSTDTKVISTMCNYDSNVYCFSSLYPGITREDCKGTGCVESQGLYSERLRNVKATLTGNTAAVRGAVRGGQILQIGDAHAASGVNGEVFQGITYGNDEHRGLDVNNERNGTGGNAKKMSEIIDGTYAGVFSTLYISLLNMGKNFKVTKSNSDSVFVNVLNEGLSFLFLLIITIPLLAVTIVFAMRIFILRIAIAISPIIVLFAAFELSKSDTVSKIIDDVDILKYFKISNLIPIIFSPVIICFAISLCSVLVKIIENINKDVIETTELSILSGIIKLNIASFGVNLGKIICSIICLATTRFILRACIKATKLGDSKIITGIKDLTRTAIGSFPIVPIPTKEGVKAVGIDSAFGLNGKQSIGDSLNQSLKNRFSEENQLAIDDIFGENKNNKNNNNTADPKITTEYISGIQAESNIQTPRTDMPIGTSGLKFNDMNQTQQEAIIDEINRLEDAKKDVLGNVSQKITIGGTEYSYNQSNHKYEPNQNSGGNGSTQ